MGLFGKPVFLDRDIDDWMFETWAWLMLRFGGMQRLKAAPLVTPSREFFPPTQASGAERAAHVFDCVKSAMGLKDWPCELRRAERPPQSAQVSRYVFLRSGGAEGAFQVTQDGAVIVSYAADLESDPVRLVATFAHELSHYLLASLREEPPGGHELHELATELTVAYAGFGVFAGNVAFQFEQHHGSGEQGWSSRRSGYLSEQSWALAIAIFLELTGRRGAADKWLKPSLKTEVDRAGKYLDRRPDRLEPLRAIP